MFRTQRMVRLGVAVVPVAVLALWFPRYCDRVYAGKIESCRQGLLAIDAACRDSNTEDSAPKRAPTLQALLEGRYLAELPVCPFGKRYADPVATSDGDAPFASDKAGHFDAEGWRTATAHL